MVSVVVISVIMMMMFVGMLVKMFVMFIVVFFVIMCFMMLVVMGEVDIGGVIFLLCILGFRWMNIYFNINLDIVYCIG